MIPRPPRLPCTDPLFPYTLSFRAAVEVGVAPILYSGRARSRIAFLVELVSKGKSLAGADLRNADLSFIELNWVDFSDAMLDGACFRGASIRCANFRGSSAVGARFDGANVAPGRRSEERRVGNECVSTCSSRGSPYR